MQQTSSQYLPTAEMVICPGTTRRADKCDIGTCKCLGRRRHGRVQGGEAWTLSSSGGASAGRASAEGQVSQTNQTNQAA